MSTDSIQSTEKNKLLVKILFKFIIALVIIGITSLIFYLLIKAKTLPVFLAFLLPITFGLIGSLLYFTFGKKQNISSYGVQIYL